MDSNNDSKKFNLNRRSILPGFADGRYVAAPKYDPSEFTNGPLEDPLRRDNRVNIRVSGQDMSALHRMALAEGMPLQSLLAQIVHQYANGALTKVESGITQQTPRPAPLSDEPDFFPRR